jgi:hypothetical protein
MDIEPGAFREMHWHPNADEWQFVMSGEGRVVIFGSHGRVKTMAYGPGMISFVKQGYGHFVENTGTETLRLLILFNAPTYEEILLTSLGVTSFQTPVIAQFRGVDTRHGCHAECDAPSAFVRCRVKVADGPQIELWRTSRLGVGPSWINHQSLLTRANQR